MALCITDNNATSKTHLQLFIDFSILQLLIGMKYRIAKEQHMCASDLGNGKHGDGKNKKAR